MFLLTVKGLNPTPVIIWQLVPVCVDILISRVHQCTSVPGVIQAQCMAKLVGRHQQQIHTSTKQITEKQVRHHLPDIQC